MRPALQALAPLYCHTLVRYRPNCPSSKVLMCGDVPDLKAKISSWRERLGPVDLSYPLLAEQRLDMTLDPSLVGRERAGLLGVAAFGEIEVTDLVEHHLGPCLGFFHCAVMAEFGLSDDRAG